MSKFYEQQGVAMTCRRFDEYVRMFSLTAEDLNGGELLDVAAGASSFTAEAGRRGIRSHAVDPRYDLASDVVHADAALEIETSTAKLAGLSGRMDFSYYGTLENHRAMREASLALFYEDYASAGRGEQYSPGALPALSFDTGRFRTCAVQSFFVFVCRTVWVRVSFAGGKGASSCMPAWRPGAHLSAVFAALRAV